MAIPQLSPVQPFRLKRTAVSNIAYTILSTDVYVAQTGTMSAARIFTLPSAVSFGSGCVIWVADESGSVTATFTITITRAGTDTINGATTAVLNAAFAKGAWVSDGTSKWTRLV